jgi:Uncharacterised nucleotidyltransferase
MTGQPGTPALLTLVRGILRPAPEALAALGAVSWAELVEQATRHGLPAVVLHELERIGLTPPAEHSGPLTDQARRRVAKSLQARVLLRRALTALAAERVVPVLLKGYGLASRLYPHPLSRPLSDVDLLVAPEEMPRAEAALSSLGLKRFVDPGLGDLHDEHHHVSFSGPGGLVELHFRALSGFGDASLDHAHLAPALRSAELDGLPVRFLGPEDELVYLSSHAATHFFQRVGWLLDVALLLKQHPDLDWRRVEETARAARVQSAFRVASRALSTALQVELPAPLREHVGAWGGPQVHLVERLVTEDELVSQRLSQTRVRSFALRALMADHLTAVGLHVLKGALRGTRRALVQRLQGHTAA